MGSDADNFVSKVVGGNNEDSLVAYHAVEIMVWLATADLSMTAETGLTRYLEEIRRFPMLEPHEEYMLAKRWREHGDRAAAHKLVIGHLRLVAKIAMGYRGYGLPISEVISEGNVGLMQAVKRFEPEKGFRPATYAMGWIKAAIQEYPALVVVGEDGYHRQPEEAVLQPAQGQEQDLRAGRGRPAPRPGQAHRQTPGRDRAGRGRHESPPRRRRVAQRPNPRRRRFRRMAGLARRRSLRSGDAPGRGRGIGQPQEGAR